MMMRLSLDRTHATARFCSPRCQRSLPTTSRSHVRLLSTHAAVCIGQHWCSYGCGSCGGPVGRGSDAELLPLQVQLAMQGAIDARTLWGGESGSAALSARPRCGRVVRECTHCGALSGRVLSGRATMRGPSRPQTEHRGRPHALRRLLSPPPPPSVPLHGGRLGSACRCARTDHGRLGRWRDGRTA